MIKHIVMWRLRDEAAGVDKLNNAKELKKRLEALKDKIRQIKHIEAGINIDDTDAASDVVLYSEFDHLDDLKTYQKHPEHIKIIDFLNVIRTEKRVVDFEA